MNKELQALPVLDGQDPLNSYHEIVRRAFDSIFFEMFDGQPGRYFYDSLSEEQRARFRQTAFEADRFEEHEFNENSRLSEDMFYEVHSRLYDYVFSYLPAALEA